MKLVNFLKKHSDIISIIVCDVIILASIISLVVSGLSFATIAIGVLAFAVGLPRVTKLLGVYDLKSFFKKEKEDCCDCDEDCDTCTGNCNDCDCDCDEE